MDRPVSKILAFVAIVALQPAWGGGDGGVTTAALAQIPGGIWFGKSSVITGFGTGATVEVATRGMVAVDGTGYFLVRNTVLRAHFPLNGYFSTVNGAPVVGTAPDNLILLSNLRLHFGTGDIQQQSLNLRWCPVPGNYIDPDICVSGWDRMLLTYSRSYESGSSLTRIAGHYVDTLGQYKGVLTIAADGYVFMQDPATGCVVNGRVAIINRSYSVYSIKLAYANCRSPTLKSATFAGLMSYNGSAKQIFALMLGTAGGASAASRLAFKRQ